MGLSASLRQDLNDLQKRSALARKVGVAHALRDCINAKF